MSVSAIVAASVSVSAIATASDCSRERWGGCGDGVGRVWAGAVGRGSAPRGARAVGISVTLGSSVTRWRRARARRRRPERPVRLQAEGRRVPCVHAVAAAERDDLMGRVPDSAGSSCHPAHSALCEPPLDGPRPPWCHPPSRLPDTTVLLCRDGGTRRETRRGTPPSTDSSGAPPSRGRRGSGSSGSPPRATSPPAAASGGRAGRRRWRAGGGAARASALAPAQRGAPLARQRGRAGR